MQAALFLRQGWECDLSKGFSLIELLVVVTIMGILGAVGVVGYQSYVDAVRADTSVGNGDTISRALDMDFISITNDLGGPSSITEGTVTKTTRCYEYIEQIVNGLNGGTMKNAYTTNETLAINMHDSANQPASRAELDFGQIGFMCSDPCVNVDSPNFYMKHCVCVQSGTDDETATGCQSPSFNSTAYIGAAKSVTNASSVAMTLKMPCILNDANNVNEGCDTNASTLDYICPTPAVISGPIATECTN